MATTERQAGYAWAARLRGKPVDADALARLGKADDAAFQNPHSAQTAIAAERAAAEACFARAFPGRTRRA